MDDDPVVVRDCDDEPGQYPCSFIHFRPMQGSTTSLESINPVRMLAI